MQVPAPQRPWLSALFAGDRAALPARIAELGALISQQRDPLLDELPDFSAGENWEWTRFNARVTRAHTRAAEARAQLARLARAEQRGAGSIAARLYHPGDKFDATKGYEGEGPGPRFRARSTPARPRVQFDAIVMGGPATAARRQRLIADFEGWLVTRGERDLDTLAGDPPALDRLLAIYAQALWDDDAPQSHLPELLNGIRKRHPDVGGRLKGAWDVRTAWQHLEPGDNKAPVPPRLARAIVSVALMWAASSAAWLEFAALVLLTFAGALRPGDVLGLLRHDLRFEDEHGGFGGDLYVVLRFAKTAAMRGARWQHVRIKERGVVRVVCEVFRARRGDAQLFTHAGTYPQRARALAAKLQAVLRFLDVPYGLRDGFVFSGLRAGGITELFQRTEDLPLTRWRGRWDSWKSMEHYIQELQASFAFAGLHVDVRQRVYRLSDALPRAVARALARHPGG